jgi:hypothetical protein
MGITRTPMNTSIITMTTMIMTMSRARRAAISSMFARSLSR